MTVQTIEAQPAEKKKLRVAAYCRVSTDNDDQRESLETQKAHYEAWIRLHSEWECAGIFYDFGIISTKADIRDGLQALLYECRIDYILTKSVSRFSRNTTDCLALVRELLSYHVPIYFEKEKLDTGSMETELILAILSSLAQEESESISKNVKWAYQKRIKNGRYKAGTAPYGYTFDSDGKATGRRLHRANLHGCEKRYTAPPVHMAFDLSGADRHFNDPAEQAEYIYSLIEVKV